MVNLHNAKNLPGAEISGADLARVELVAVNALEQATEIHNELGANGAAASCTNAFGETALECDVRCEEVVLKALESAGLCGVAYTEEHGLVQVGAGADFTFTLDGLDGTRRYVEAPGRERYATMLSILHGANPLYDDYLICASKEHALGALYLARKNGGGVLVDGKGTNSLSVSGVKKLAHVKKAYLDAYWPFNEGFYGPLTTLLAPQYLKASCIYYHDLANGQADLVFECTRKRNLELACAYGLVREAGGVVELSDGSSLGTKRYREFGQINEQGDIHIAVISAASGELLGEVRRLLQSPDLKNPL